MKYNCISKNIVINDKISKIFNKIVNVIGICK